MKSVTGSTTYSLLTAFLQVAYGNTKCHKTDFSLRLLCPMIPALYRLLLTTQYCRPDSCRMPKNTQLTCTTQTLYDVFLVCKWSDYTWKCVRVFWHKTGEWICITVTASFCFASQKHASISTGWLLESHSISVMEWYWNNSPNLNNICLNLNTSWTF